MYCIVQKLTESSDDDSATSEVKFILDQTPPDASHTITLSTTQIGALFIIRISSRHGIK